MTDAVADDRAAGAAAACGAGRRAVGTVAGAEVNPDLRAVLLRRRFLHGSLGGYPLGDGSDRYVLVIYHGAAAKGRFTLPWPEYFEAFCYWQELTRPGTGNAGRPKRRAA